jgi:uncharacterized membrane protein
MVATVTEAITVDAPISAVYGQWAQFEEFPRFMEGVESVQQVDDTHLHWVADIGGKRHEWDAEIVEQRLDHLIAWRSLGGHDDAGRVLIEGADDTTKVVVEMQHETEGMMEALGAVLGADGRRVRKDLERFKELVEKRASETGAWGGEFGRGPGVS